MDSLNHTCIICGIPYHHCDDCGMKGDTPWKIVCDKLECYQLYLTMNDFRAGRVSRDEAKEAIEAIGVNADTLIPSVREVVDGIMDDE